MTVELGAIAHVIQLSVAPVFLLTGVGAILSVLANRVARIVDRARALHTQPAAGDSSEQSEVRSELRTLAYRARLINWAISLCVICALLISTLIVALFICAFWSVNASSMVASLFTAAMLALIGGLLCFLREVYVATANIRIAPRHRVRASKGRRNST
jgi:hypothetical protein